MTRSVVFLATGYVFLLLLFSFLYYYVGTWAPTEPSTSVIQAVYRSVNIQTFLGASGMTPNNDITRLLMSFHALSIFVLLCVFYSLQNSVKKK
jgi:hypothetical protein